MAAKSQQIYISRLHLPHHHRNTLWVSTMYTNTNIRTPTKIKVVIDIHGGAFMLGHSRMVSLPQVKDCLDRGWIVLVPNHRLCPGVNILEGPMQDIRDLLTWIHDGHLNKVLCSHGT